MGMLTRGMKQGAIAPMAQAQGGNDLSTFEGLLESKSELFHSILKSQDPKRFLSVAMQIASDKKLNTCSPESLVNCFVGIAQYDLSPGIGGEAYIIPYKNTATLQIGYKGYRQLLYRAGWVVQAHPVYKCDKFTYKIDGVKTISSLEPDFMARQEDDKSWVIKNLVGVYVAAEDDFNREIFGFVSKRVIEKLRLTSANQTYVGQYTKPADAKKIKAGEPVGIWEDWYEEMAIAKAVKKFSKSLPISDQRVKQILANDDQIEIGNSVDFEKEVVSEAEVLTNGSDAVMQLISNVESLGFKSTGPTEKNGNFYLMATPLREDANFHGLADLGFGDIGGKLVMKITHLM